MEDAAEALKLAFSVFAFVIALGVAFATFNQSKRVSDIVISANDRTYVESYTEADLENPDNGRIVGAETVIPTLYRYYKEKYSIDIANNSNKVLELFDLEKEQQYSRGNLKKTDLYEGTSYGTLYPTGITWIGSATNTDAKLRVDSYITHKMLEINHEKTNPASEFDFNDIYFQRFDEIQTGVKKTSINPEDPNAPEPDGTYFILEAGTKKMNIHLRKVN